MKFRMLFPTVPVNFPNSKFCLIENGLLQACGYKPYVQVTPMASFSRKLPSLTLMPDRDIDRVHPRMVRLNFAKPRETALADNFHDSLNLIRAI